MLRKSEPYIKNDIIITPFMVDANVYVDIEHNGDVITLTKHEFDCLRSGYERVREHYNFLKLLVIDDKDQLDIPFPSHIYANNVLELSSECFMFAAHHNNVLMVCLSKHTTVCFLTDAIFDVDFNIVSHTIDQLMVSFVANWCVYCLNHRSLKKCVVCVNS